MLVAVPGGSSLGSVLLGVAGVNAKKLEDGILSNFELNGIELLPKIGKSAPVSIWEISENDLEIYMQYFECKPEIRKKMIGNHVVNVIYNDW